MNKWWKAVATPSWHWVGWVQCAGGGALILGTLLGLDLPHPLEAVVLPIFAVGLIFVLRDVAQYRATGHLATGREDSRS